MVVLIAGDDVEGHPPELLLDGILGEPEPPKHEEGLLVAVRSCLVVVEMGDRAERQHVHPAARGRAIEAPGHEVATAVLLEQARGRHHDAGLLRHLRVGVFDDAEAERIFQLLVAIAAYAVELE